MCTPRLAEGVFVFITVKESADLKGVTPQMRFQEEEGETLILLRDDAVSRGLSYEYPCRMITLDVHSSLKAVGLIAWIATELSRHGISVNPVSGFYHDHLFVPEGRETEAMRILGQVIAGVSKV